MPAPEHGEVVVAARHRRGEGVSYLDLAVAVARPCTYCNDAPLAMARAPVTLSGNEMILHGLRAQRAATVPGGENPAHAPSPLVLLGELMRKQEDTLPAATARAVGTRDEAGGNDWRSARGMRLNACGLLAAACLVLVVAVTAALAARNPGETLPPPAPAAAAAAAAAVEENAPETMHSASGEEAGYAGSDCGVFGACFGSGCSGGSSYQEVVAAGAQAAWSAWETITSGILDLGRQEDPATSLAAADVLAELSTDFRGIFVEDTPVKAPAEAPSAAAAAGAATAAAAGPRRGPGAASPGWPAAAWWLGEEKNSAAGTSARGVTAAVVVARLLETRRKEAAANAGTMKLPAPTAAAATAAAAAESGVAVGSAASSKDLKASGGGAAADIGGGASGSSSCAGGIGSGSGNRSELPRDPAELSALSPGEPALLVGWEASLTGAAEFAQPFRRTAADFRASGGGQPGSGGGSSGSGGGGRTSYAFAEEPTLAERAWPLLAGFAQEALAAARKGAAAAMAYNGPAGAATRAAAAAAATLCGWEREEQAREECEQRLHRRQGNDDDSCECRRDAAVVWCRPVDDDPLDEL